MKTGVIQGLTSLNQIYWKKRKKKKNSHTWFNILRIHQIWLNILKINLFEFLAKLYEITILQLVYWNQLTLAIKSWVTASTYKKNNTGHKNSGHKVPCCDEACFMHLTPGVVHNFPNYLGV